MLEAVEPVKLTQLPEWTGRSLAGELRVMGLDPALSADQAEALDVLGRGCLGLHYGGAFSWSDERVYCSELGACR